MENDIRKWLNIINESDNIVKGPWGAKDTLSNTQSGYGNMIDITTGQKVKGPIDPSKLKPISLSSVFASNGFNVIKDMGYNFCEKPSYFSDLNNPEYQIPKQNIAAIERKLGHKLEIYQLEDILYPKCDRKGNCEYYPMFDVNFDEGGIEPDDITFIVEAIDDDPSGNRAFKAGEMFLCDRTGAKKYIRMWAKLV